MNELERIMKMFKDDKGRGCGKRAYIEGGVDDYKEHIKTCGVCQTTIRKYDLNPESLRKSLEKESVRKDLEKYILQSSI